MEMDVIKCPNCGANATNHKNCEYCGSLLVRFAEKGIEISDTSYIDDSLVFPGLLEELEKNLRLQEKGNKDEEVWTEICWLNKKGDEDWLIISSKESDSDEEDIEKASGNEIPTSPQLVIQVGFSTWTRQDEISFNHNNEQDEQFMRFTQLRSYPLFSYRKYEKGIDDDLYTRDFDINFGQDAKCAARLVSEILVKVKGLSPSESYGIYTGVGDECYSDTYKAWRKKYGLKDYYEEFEGSNTESDNDEYSEEQEDNNWGEWHKILVCICSIPLGICIIKHWPTRFWCNWFYLIGCVLLLIVLGLFWIRRLPKKYFYYFLIPYFILPICFLNDFKMPKFRWLDQKDSSDKIELLENSNEDRKIEETKQTPEKSRKDEIRELGFNDGVNFGYSDGGDALREYVRSGQTLQNGLDHMQKVIAKVAYKEEYGNNISEELLDEYAKQFVEGYKSVVLKK